MAVPANALSPANVLVLAPTMDPGERDACHDFLTVTPAAASSVLFVTLTQPADERLRFWRDHVGEPLPGTVGVVSAGEITRAAASDGDPHDERPSAVAIETVESPGNLTQLGVAITNVLSEWEGQIVVCFHSITTALQYVDPEGAFKFLHTLTQFVRAVDGIAHYHMDPGAHDEQVVSTLRPVFDTVVDLRGGDRTAVERTPEATDELEGPDRERGVSVRIQPGERPVDALGRAIAAMGGAAAVEDAAPRDWVDPTHVDGMLSAATGPPVEDVQVRFRLRAHEVTIDRDRVSVVPLDGS